MKDFFHKIKIYFAVLFVCIAVFTSFFVSEANADGDPEVPFKIETDFGTSSVYEYNGYLYIPASGNQTMAMSYAITNTSDKTLLLTFVHLSESLVPDGGIDVGDSKQRNYEFDLMPLSPGDQYIVDGYTLSFTDNNDFTFNYGVIIKYFEEGDELIPENEKEASLSDIFYLSREHVELEVTYDYITTQDKLYLDDTVILNFTITSNSLVPVRNIMVYDTFYGYIDQISEILPGQTMNVQREISLNQSTFSSPYITHSYFKDSERPVTVEFPDQTIQIEVSNHDFYLGFEVTSPTTYIPNGQMVDIDFTVTNLGSGKIQHVTVTDNFGDVLFEIEMLEAGQRFTKTLSILCSPGNKYAFNCRSPQTATISDYVEFYTMPGMELKYVFDKRVDEYKYGDTVNVVYTITNHGSISAQNLILTDSGINFSIDIGELLPGEEKSINHSYMLEVAITEFKPNISGNYVDFGDGQIFEQAKATQISVVMPEKLVDVELVYTYEPTTVHYGDNVKFTFTVTNIGESTLIGYRIYIAENSKVINVGTRLEPKQSETFSVEFVIEQRRRFTVHIDGVNEYTMQKYNDKYFVVVDVVQGGTINRPTADPSDDIPVQTLPPITDDTPKTNGTFIAVIVLCSVAVVMTTVTVCLLVNDVLKKRRNNN